MPYTTILPNNEIHILHEDWDVKGGALTTVALGVALCLHLLLLLCADVCVSLCVFCGTFCYCMLFCLVWFSLSFPELLSTALLCMRVSSHHDLCSFRSYCV